MIEIKNIDYLPDGLTFDDLEPKSDGEKLRELANSIELPDFTNFDVVKDYAEFFGIELPTAQGFTSGNFASTYEALNAINESLQRQTLKKDLLYASIDEFLAKQEVISKLTRIDTEKILQAYNKLGFINDADQITIPKGTQCTWKATKMYNGKTYDLYYVKGNPYALLAICTDDVLDVFEEI